MKRRAADQVLLSLRRIYSFSSDSLHFMLVGMRGLYGIRFRTSPSAPQATCRASRRDDRPLNEVLQLADVARPFPSRKRL
jgi:hypothetical protein